MRRSTAVRRLGLIAQRCQRVCDLWDPDQGLVVVQAYGAVLEPVEEDGSDGSVEVVQVALVVNEPPDVVTWGARPPAYAGLPYVLELEKAPVDWCFRSAAAPLGNHRIDRPLRIWSRAAGVDEEALAALGAGRADALREPRPRPPVFKRHLEEELAAAEARLRDIRDRYWSRAWRGDHHGAGSYPENHLWDAVQGYLDLRDAVAALGPGDCAGGAEPVEPQVGAGSGDRAEAGDVS